MFNKKHLIEFGKLQGENSRLVEENTQLKKTLEILQNRLDGMQDAFLAVKDINAYSILNLDSSNTPSVLVPDSLSEKERKIYSDYISQAEGPLFQNSDELEDLFYKMNKGMGVPQAEAVHNNEES